MTVAIDGASLTFDHATVLVILRRQPKDRRTKSFRRQAVSMREPFLHLSLVPARGRRGGSAAQDFVRGYLAPLGMTTMVRE
jgi:hypothetical protein